MRMELKEGISGCKLVNDSYNSDINSLALSLDYLVSVAGGQPKILILSDIRQSGLPAEKLYEQSGSIAAHQRNRYADRNRGRDRPACGVIRLRQSVLPQYG